MSLSINTNVNALFAQKAITNNSLSQTQAMQQLSTGLQINQASDNAAGLAVSQSMTSQINGLGQSIQNANDGINMLQTADSAMSTQQQMLQTMFTLATQAANGTYSSSQRSYMNTEFTQLAKQVDNIATQTTWNGMTLLTGTKTAGDSGGIGLSANGKAQFQVGTKSGFTINVTITSMTAKGLGVSGLTISTAAKGSTALSTLNTALTTLNSSRSTVGASVNQLTYAAQDLTNVAQNISTSRAAITDTNYATASTNLSRSQIIAQAATAMLAQANQQDQAVLTLLK